MQKKKRFQISNKIKIGKSIRNFLIIFLIGSIIVAFYEIIQSFNIGIGVIKEKKEIYKYTNRGDLIAKINLKENQYVDENEVVEGQVYLSDLISDIDLDIEYTFDGSKTEEIMYDYKIDAIVNASYSSPKEVYDILNKTETLKEVKEQKTTSNGFKIKDNLTVDYEKYHQLVKNFKKSMSITADSNLILRLTINTKLNVDENDIGNKYVVDYKISVGDKVAIIDKVNKNKEKDTIDKEVQIEDYTDVNYTKIIINVVIIIIALLGLKMVISKTEELKVIKNEFKGELKKILKSYGDKIVEIQDLQNIDIEKATKVKDIVQIRKLAEEALVPIYCYVKDEQEAYFIVTKYENSYIYILK